MKNIVVFGATGDTGRYLIDYFIETGYPKDFNIIACGTRESNYFENKNIEYIKIDIRKKEDFANLPSSVYAVIDLAGIMPARMKGYDPQKYIDINITGNLNILEYCRENHADRILYAQSFGDIKDYSEKNIVLHPFMERNFSFKTDHTIYVMTKNFTVDMIHNYHEMYGLKSFIFRLPTIYLYSPIDEYYVDGIIRKIGYRVLIDKAINGENIEIWGDKTRKKDMVYVKDFCQMLYKATFVNLKNGHYNVGTGIGTTLEDQINGIIEVFGNSSHKSKIIDRPDKPNAPQYIMDITNAVNELNYHPKYDYISMLKDFKNEMEKQRK
ncbi:MAG: NAD(P)-dependent oxidoreductase [Clostridia bacterium]|nr:NAD(P)-dependent oxidoreductase [Clostridia bacterium]